MHNNTTAPTGTENKIPCKSLVGILGWAMELKHLGLEVMEDTNELLFESFIADPSADQVQERREAILFHKEIKELCRLLAIMTPEETKQLNQFLLNICEDEMKRNAA